MKQQRHGGVLCVLNQLNNKTILEDVKNTEAEKNCGKRT
jgi:hypothetical protein